MKIGILSDTHNQRERAARAVARLVEEGAEVLVHCGDMTSPEVAYELAARPAYVVLGNCDDDESGLKYAVEAIGGTWLGLGGTVELGGKRVAVTHGHDPRTVRELLAGAPDYQLQGHSHVAGAERQGASRRLNPGALHRAAEFSVALLETDTDAVRWLKVR
jgi:putative phosphoesterase